MRQGAESGLICMTFFKEIANSIATNFEQIFTTYSPETVRKIL